jgi:hypothetical protein
MAWTLWDSFNAQSSTLVPIFLAGIVLIGLNVYTLVTSEQPNEYLELFLALLVSTTPVLFGLIMLPIGLLSGSVWVVLTSILMIVFSPIGLTLMKINNPDAMSFLTILSTAEAMSILVIASTAYSMLYVSAVSFRGLLSKR